MAASEPSSIVIIYLLSQVIKSSSFVQVHLYAPGMSLSRCMYHKSMHGHAICHYPNAKFSVFATPTIPLRKRHQTETVYNPIFAEEAPKTERLASRVSNHQAVFLRAGASSGTVWQFQRTTHGKDGSLNRILAKGSPVFADAEVG